MTPIRYAYGETGPLRLCSARSTSDLPAEQAQQLTLPREPPVCGHCGFARRVDQTRAAGTAAETATEKQVTEPQIVANQEFYSITTFHQ